MLGLMKISFSKLLRKTKTRCSTKKVNFHKELVMKKMGRCGLGEGPSEKNSNAVRATAIMAACVLLAACGGGGGSNNGGSGAGISENAKRILSARR